MNKKNVFKDYDEITDWFDEYRSRDLREDKYLDKVLKLKPSGKILI